MKRKNPLFANIQYSIGYVYRWIVRATKCQGFGIQSPWAFRFARNVINEHKSVVVMPHIYKNSVNKRLWRFIVNDTKGQECFDLYYCGLAFLDQKRHPHYYKINF